MRLMFKPVDYKDCSLLSVGLAQSVEGLSRPDTDVPPAGGDSGQADFGYSTGPPGASA